MKNIYLLTVLFVFITISNYAQKKPLDHTVYDQWQSIGERLISDDGQYIAFQVNPQEGDGVLIINSLKGLSSIKIERGYNAVFTDNYRYLICKIKPLFSETREAKIKKKKPDEMPKDSLAIVELSTGICTKVPRVKSFKIPEENATTLAYLMEKSSSEISSEEGTNLIIKNLINGDSAVYPLVSEYFFNKKGTVLLWETTKKAKDSLSKATVVLSDLIAKKSAVILQGFNDAKSYSMDEDGRQLAFVAERDSSVKALQKFYQLYYYKVNTDSAVMMVNQFTSGMPDRSTVSEFSNIGFSKSGKRLFFGTAPVLPVKDTSLPEFERVNVDVWAPMTIIFSRFN